MSATLKWIAGVFSSIMVLACAPAPSDLYDGYGLRSIEITVSEDEYARMLGGGHEKNQVSARLRIDELGVGGKLSLAGQGSFDHIKRGFSFEVSDPENGHVPYDAFRFSAQMQDPSFLRTLLGYQVFSFLEIPTPEVEPVALYMNGQYLGLYMMIEKITPDFFRRRGFRPERLYKSRVGKSDFGPRMTTDPEVGLEAEMGEFHSAEIQRIAEWANSPAENDGLDRAETYFDLFNFTRFFAGNIFLGNCDGFKNNIYLLKTQGDDRFSFAPWDWERSYDGMCDFNLLIHTNHLLAKILEYPSLKQLLVETLLDLRRQFSADKVRSIVGSELSRINPAYRKDRYLGGLNRDQMSELEILMGIYSDWQKQVAKLAEDGHA